MQAVIPRKETMPLLRGSTSPSYEYSLGGKPLEEHMSLASSDVEVRSSSGSATEAS